MLNDDGTRTTYVYDAADRARRSAEVSGITTYSYDASGNQRQVETPAGDVTTLAWSFENQLAQVEHPDGSLTTYVYAPVNKVGDELRVSKETDAGREQYVWDNQNIIRELDDTNLTQAEYSYNPQPYGHLVSQHREGESAYFHFDALGSTESLTDPTGVKIDDYVYAAFGKILAQTGTTVNPFTWVGQQGYYRDDETGRYTLRRREYDAQLARFLSQDPLGFDAGDENLYRYVGNNAPNKVDPSGEEEIPKCNKATQFLLQGGQDCRKTNQEKRPLTREDFDRMTQYLRDNPCQSCDNPTPKKEPTPECPSATSLLMGLAQRHANSIRRGVGKALKDGTAKDVLDPYQAFLNDLQQALETAERCDLLPDSALQALRQAVQTAQQVVNELQQIEDLPVGVVLDILQLMLGGFGLIPGFGEPADIIDAALSFARSDYLGAVLGAVCIIPIAGMLPRAADFIFKRGPKVLQGLLMFGVRSRKLLTLIRSMFEQMGKLCPSSLKSYLDTLIQKLDDQIKKRDDEAAKATPTKTEPNEPPTGGGNDPGGKPNPPPKPRFEVPTLQKSNSVGGMFKQMLDFMRDFKKQGASQSELADLFEGMAKQIADVFDGWKATRDLLPDGTIVFLGDAAQNIFAIKCDGKMFQSNPSNPPLKVVNGIPTLIFELMKSIE